MIADPRTLLNRIFASELPLKSGRPEYGEITAFVSLVEESVEAYIITPGGAIYHLAPPTIEPGWWSFALRNYYIVTGNLVDRQILADRCQVDSKLVLGKCFSRHKASAPSGMSLQQLLDCMCPAQQTALFS